jgi:hypothetical protein
LFETRLSVAISGAMIPDYQTLLSCSQSSVIGMELLLKHFKVGGLLRPAAVLAVSYLTGPPFIEAFLPGLSEERDLKPPDPNEDVVYDDEPKQKWRPPEEIEAEEFFRPLDEP